MRTLLVVAFASLAACGGSGVDSDKLVVDLSDTEINDLCNYVIEKQGGARTEECEDAEGVPFTVDFPTFDECVDDILARIDECTATVRQEEECAERLGDDPCSDPNACHSSDECY